MGAEGMRDTGTVHLDIPRRPDVRRTEVLRLVCVACLVTVAWCMGVRTTSANGNESTRGSPAAHACWAVIVLLRGTECVGRALRTPAVALTLGAKLVWL